MSDYNTPDLLSETDVTIEANKAGIYVEYYDESSGDTVKNKKGLFSKLTELFVGASDSAWTTVTSLSNGWTGTIRYILRAGMVTIDLTGLNGSSQTTTVPLNLSAAYRPASNITAPVVNSSTSPYEIGDFTVGTSGNLSITGDAADGTSIYGSISYPVL
jgi:hypothetical protein